MCDEGQGESAGASLNSVPCGHACCEVSGFDRSQSSECAHGVVVSSCSVSWAEGVFTDHPHMHHDSLTSCPVSFVVLVFPCFSLGSLVVTHRCCSQFLAVSSECCDRFMAQGERDYQFINNSNNSKNSNNSNNSSSSWGDRGERHGVRLASSCYFKARVVLAGAVFLLAYPLPVASGAVAGGG